MWWDKTERLLQENFMWDCSVFAFYSFGSGLRHRCSRCRHRSCGCCPRRASRPAGLRGPARPPSGWRSAAPEQTATASQTHAALLTHAKVTLIAGPGSGQDCVTYLIAWEGVWHLVHLAVTGQVKARRTWVVNKTVTQHYVLAHRVTRRLNTLMWTIL